MEDDFPTFNFKNLSVYRFLSPGQMGALLTFAPPLKGYVLRNAFSFIIRRAFKVILKRLYMLLLLLLLLHAILDSSAYLVVHTISFHLQLLLFYFATAFVTVSPLGGTGGICNENC